MTHIALDLYRSGLLSETNAMRRRDGTRTIDLNGVREDTGM
jgi:hypothetical protein